MYCRCHSICHSICRIRTPPPVPAPPPLAVRPLQPSCVEVNYRCYCAHTHYVIFINDDTINRLDTHTATHESKCNREAYTGLLRLELRFSAKDGLLTADDWHCSLSVCCFLPPLCCSTRLPVVRSALSPLTLTVLSAALPRHRSLLRCSATALFNATCALHRTLRLSLRCACCASHTAALIAHCGVPPRLFHTAEVLHCQPCRLLLSSFVALTWR